MLYLVFLAWSREHFSTLTHAAPVSYSKSDSNRVSHDFSLLQISPLPNFFIMIISDVARIIAQHHDSHYYNLFLHLDVLTKDIVF